MTKFEIILILVLNNLNFRNSNLISRKPKNKIRYSKLFTISKLHINSTQIKE